MKRWTPATPTGAPDVPVMLTVPVLEVWGTRRRYADACTAWRAATGLPAEVAFRVLPARAPWRVAALDAAGQSALVDARLQHLGVTRTQLPDLRAEASAYPVVLSTRP